MKKGMKTVCYDEELNIEAYQFNGIIQPFPNHFHDYYVIGVVESGERCLSCKNKDYVIKAGDVLLFNPNDNHGCSQIGKEALDYREINIPSAVMLSLMKEFTGKDIAPIFTENVIYDNELKTCVKSLHKMLMEEAESFEKEEMLYMLISMLAERYLKVQKETMDKCSEKIEQACEFMARHYSESISLNQLCECSRLGKSTLLREFTKLKGVTPYRYLQSTRIGKAKELLEHGVSPVDAAVQTGFSDQSHFTKFFQMYIGLTPAEYGKMFKRLKDE
ncbi:MAG: AraC family transcriptional regulator [Eubacterium sp.]|nr:AraC family transcriptional regulator [Eubacterium sp.]